MPLHRSFRKASSLFLLPLLLNSAVPAFALKTQEFDEGAGAEELGNELKRFARAAGLIPPEPAPTVRPLTGSGRTVSITAGAEERIRILPNTRMDIFKIGGELEVKGLAGRHKIVDLDDDTIYTVSSLDNTRRPFNRDAHALSSILQAVYYPPGLEAEEWAGAPTIAVRPKPDKNDSVFLYNFHPAVKHFVVELIELRGLGTASPKAKLNFRAIDSQGRLANEDMIVFAAENMKEILARVLTPKEFQLIWDSENNQVNFVNLGTPKLMRDPRVLAVLAEKKADIIRKAAEKDRDPNEEGSLTRSVPQGGSATIFLTHGDDQSKWGPVAHMIVTKIRSDDSTTPRATLFFSALPSVRVLRASLYRKTQGRAGAEEAELGLWRKQKKFAPKLFEYRVREADRQHETINLIASETITPDWILEFMGDVSSNKYAEGYPVSEDNPMGRFYPGTEVVDDAERYIQEEWLNVAQSIYPSVRKEYRVNVQPHSGSSANAATYLALLLPGDSLLGMDLISGGHLTHGFRLSFSGIVFDSKQFKVDPKTGKIDYQALREQALKERPHLIVAGGTAYTHPLDWDELRRIADAVTAKNQEEGKDLPPTFLVADVAHNWAQILVGDYPSPFGKAHYITLTTHKTRGPRGGLFYASTEVIESLNRYMGMDPAKDKARIESTSLAKRGDMAVIPGLQGGPLMNVILAKGGQAIFLQTEEFRQYAKQIRPNAKALAAALMKRDPRVKLVGDGTEVHFMLMDTRAFGMMGIPAQEELRKVGITANRNHIPVNKEDEAKLDRGFRQTLMNPAGIRIGVPSLTARGMKETEMPEVTELTLAALDNASQRLKYQRAQVDYERVQEEIRVRRRKLADRFPVYEESRKALHAILDEPAAGVEEKRLNLLDWEWWKTPTERRVVILNEGPGRLTRTPAIRLPADTVLRVAGDVRRWSDSLVVPLVLLNGGRDLTVEVGITLKPEGVALALPFSKEWKDKTVIPYPAEGNLAARVGMGRSLSEMEQDYPAYRAKISGATEAVSRKHFEMVVLPDRGVGIKDLGSRNGTWVPVSFLKEYAALPPDFPDDGPNAPLAAALDRYVEAWNRYQPYLALPPATRAITAYQQGSEIGGQRVMRAEEALSEILTKRFGDKNKALQWLEEQRESRKLSPQYYYPEPKGLLNQILTASAVNAGAEEMVYRGLWGDSARLLDPASPVIPAKPGAQFLVMAVRGPLRALEPLKIEEMSLVRFDRPERVSVAVPFGFEGQPVSQRLTQPPFDRSPFLQPLPPAVKVPSDPWPSGGREGVQLVGMPLPIKVAPEPQGLRFEIQPPANGQKELLSLLRYAWVPVDRADLWQAGREHLRELSRRLSIALRDDPRLRNALIYRGDSVSEDHKKISVGEAARLLEEDPDNVLQTAPNYSDRFLLGSASRDSLTSLQIKAEQLEQTLARFSLPAAPGAPIGAPKRYRLSSNVEIFRPGQREEQWVKLPRQETKPGDIFYFRVAQDIRHAPSGTASIVEYLVRVEPEGRLSVLDSNFERLAQWTGESWTTVVIQGWQGAHTASRVELSTFYGKVLVSSNENVLWVNHPEIGDYNVTVEQLLLASGAEEDLGYDLAEAEGVIRQAADRQSLAVTFTRPVSLDFLKPVDLAATIRRPGGPLSEAVEISLTRSWLTREGRLLGASPQFGIEVNTLPSLTLTRPEEVLPALQKALDSALLTDGRKTAGAEGPADSSAGNLERETRRVVNTMLLLFVKQEGVNRVNLRFEQARPGESYLVGDYFSGPPLEETLRDDLGQIRIPVSREIYDGLILRLKAMAEINMDWIPGPGETMSGQFDLEVAGKPVEFDLVVSTPVAGPELATLRLNFPEGEPIVGGAEEEGWQRVAADADVRSWQRGDQVRYGTGSLALRYEVLAVEASAKPPAVTLRLTGVEGPPVIYSHTVESMALLGYERRPVPAVPVAQEQPAELLGDLLTRYEQFRTADSTRWVIEHAGLNGQIPSLELALSAFELGNLKGVRRFLLQAQSRYQQLDLHGSLEELKQYVDQAVLLLPASGSEEEARPASGTTLLSFNPAAGLPLHNAGLEQVIQVAENADDAFRQVRFGFPDENLIGVLTPGMEESDYTWLIPGMRFFVRVPSRQPGWESYVIADVSSRSDGRTVVPIYETPTLAAGLEQMGVPEPVIQRVLAGLNQAYDTLNQMQ